MLGIVQSLAWQYLGRAVCVTRVTSGGGSWQDLERPLLENIMDYSDLQRLQEEKKAENRILQWCQTPMSSRYLVLLFCACAGLIIVNIVITARGASGRKLDYDLSQTGEGAGGLLQKLISGAEGRIRNFPPENETYDGACPDDWSKFRESCYYFSNMAKSWEDAKKMCERKKGKLVVINTAEEQVFVTKLAMKIRAWIGLVETDEEWKWVDGTPFSSTPKKWGPGQPDEFTGHGLGGDEDCVQLHYNGDWNDEHCSRAYRYICERKTQS
ncbi:CD209 antigen-like protein A [Hyperolius riggenbachi]|uniref:CD209 antigen-like protein A n=1 Tax=Hyperolius riggenbachi TaxID=752182 RepID=UPI0035A37289